MELKNQDIKLENIKKIYNKKIVLDIKEISISCGEVTYITGENGAGKSTLLNIIAKLDTDYSGIISGNFDSNQISLVDANPYMLKGSVYSNIKYPLEIRGNYSKEDMKKRIDQLTDKFGITLLKEKKASKLSSGETQKVAILRALSFEPKLLLLDEPTSNLDKVAKLELIEILKEYKKKGNTIIIVTHDYEFFRNLEGKKIEIEKLV